MQATATCNEFALFADDVVVDADNFTAFQAFASCRYPLFFFMSRQDTGPFTAVAEQSQALTAFFIGQKIEVFRIFDSKAVRHVDCRTDRGIDVLLPSSLHFDAFMVIQCQCRDKVFRQLAIVLDMMFFHIPFDNRCVDFVVHIRPMKRFGLSFIEVGINRFDAAGNAEHRRQRPCRGNSQELGIPHAINLDQGCRSLGRIGFEIRRAHDFIDMAFVEGAALVSQFR